MREDDDDDVEGCGGGGSRVKARVRGARMSAGCEDDRRVRGGWRGAAAGGWGVDGGQRALVRTVRGYEAATNDVALFERRDRERRGRGEERRGEERRGDGEELLRPDRPPELSPSRSSQRPQPTSAGLQMSMHVRVSARNPNSHPDVNHTRAGGLEQWSLEAAGARSVLSTDVTCRTVLESRRARIQSCSTPRTVHHNRRALVLQPTLTLRLRSIVFVRCSAMAFPALAACRGSA